MAESRNPRLRQALWLPVTLFRIVGQVRQDFSRPALDANLRSFWGFHQEPWDTAHRMRPWQKAPPSGIAPSDVQGIAIPELVMMLTIAMEDEEPIPAYTRQSGEGFRYLLPTLGRYMGKNDEESHYAAEHNLDWCEGAWCAEEKRHSNTLARIIERLTGHAPARDNPNEPMVVTADESAAVAHLISRQTTEWNASSSYVVMCAHARGHLRGMLRNLARDEIKHLAIMSAADRYLFGPRPWGRFLAILKKGLGNFTQQRRTRSGGRQLGANPATVIEGIVAHVMTEIYVRRWLRTLPLITLEKIFDTPSTLPELPVSPDAELDARNLRLAQAGADERRRLARWSEPARHRALRKREDARLRGASARERRRDAEIMRLPGSLVL